MVTTGGIVDLYALLAKPLPVPLRATAIRLAIRLGRDGRGPRGAGMTKGAGGTAPIPLGVLDDFVGYHLRRASALVGADFARVLGHTEMRQVPFAILSVVAANPGLNQGAVGRALGIQRANMVTLINELVDGGLMERSGAAGDRRVVALRLTPDGEAAVATCLALIRNHEARLFSGLDEDERRTLIALLGKISAAEP